MAGRGGRDRPNTHLIGTKITDSEDSGFATGINRVNGRSHCINRRASLVKACPNKREIHRPAICRDASANYQAQELD